MVGSFGAHEIPATLVQRRGVTSWHMTHSGRIIRAQSPSTDQNVATHEVANYKKATTETSANNVKTWSLTIIRTDAFA